MASSQLVRLSSGSDESPKASYLAQRISMYVSHLELKQLLHLVLRPAILARDGGGARRRDERGSAGRGGGVRR